MKHSEYRRFWRSALLLLLVGSIALTATAMTVTYDGTLQGTPPESTVSDQPAPEPPASSDDEEDWDDWEDWDEPDDGVIGGGVTLSTAFTPHLVCENDRYSFWYDTTGADVYIRDKRDGHIWSNTVDDAYYREDGASAALLSQLFQVSVCDEDDSISTWQMCDAVGSAADFALSPDYDSTGMTLSVQLQRAAVSFRIRFDLTENGLSVSVPADAIAQANGDRLVSIQLMPAFGAARTDRDGYILMPDGCGALIAFEGMSQQEDRVYSYPIYGQAEQDMVKLLNRDDQDIKNMMLPVYGIRGAEWGFLAAITQGAENATLNVVPYGYQAPMLGRAYFTLNYLYTESLTINGKGIEQIMALQELSDRRVEYFLLDRDACDYSDMAMAYRGYLERTGVLTRRQTTQPGAVSLDIFMGVEKNGLFFSEFVPMTTFAQVQSMVEDLQQNGVSRLELTLQGWNKGGFTCMPTSAAVAGKLGGKKGLESLTSWLGQQQIPVYLYHDFLQADTGGKSANLRKDVVRDYVSNMVMDNRRSAVMMNLFKTFRPRIAQARRAGIHDGAGFSFARAGQWLWNCYEKGNDHTRTQAQEACVAALEDCAQTEGVVQVYGGNQYVLSAATSLRELPDTSSCYAITTSAVPFYQMVVNGYVSYTSVAGNMTYNLTYQKLRWVEYGSTPYFILSWENALKLVNSDYDRLFSCEYSAWSERVAEISAEFSRRLAPLAGAVMVRHTALSKTLARVDYDNGCAVYVNYGAGDAVVDGVTVPANDYAVVPAKGGANG